METVEAPPKVFISYSHDSKTHSDWVLTLATRLVKNGVDIVLDQWDITLGSDLPRFMETHITSAKRVLVICTERYVTKADTGEGGVGYEKMILTSQLVKRISGDSIIPVVRENDLTNKVPIFLRSRVYIDFSDDSDFETKYAELLRELHGVKVKPRPPLGPNPFTSDSNSVYTALAFRPERYVSPGTSGIVTFDYESNNGRYVVGAGDYSFVTAWSTAGSSAIHAYTDGQGIRSVAIAVGKANITDIDDATLFDPSSRVRTPNLGDILIWRNAADYFLATKIEKIRCRAFGEHAELTFTYVIAPSKTASFSAKTEVG